MYIYTHTLQTCQRDGGRGALCQARGPGRARGARAGSAHRSSRRWHPVLHRPSADPVLLVTPPPVTHSPSPAPLLCVWHHVHSALLFAHLLDLANPTGGHCKGQGQQLAALAAVPVFWLHRSASLLLVAPAACPQPHSTGRGHGTARSLNWSDLATPPRPAASKHPQVIWRQIKGDVAKDVREDDDSDDD